MKVKLLRHTLDAELLVAQAAKLCYSPVGVDEIAESMTDDDVSNFVQMLADLKHESPIEHATFTFAVEGVSRTLSHQLVRHRIASYSQQSQRYVKLEQFEYIIPPAIAKNEKTKAIFEEAMKKSQEYYNEITDVLFEENYKLLIESGMSEKKAKMQAEKMSIEDARYVFPNACETKVVFTMNARSLSNFFSLRCCQRAQWEIRELAIEMLRQVKAVYPTLFKNAGPGCVRGACPEGKMTCGKAKEIREFFNNL